MMGETKRGSREGRGGPRRKKGKGRDESQRFSFRLVSSPRLNSRRSRRKERKLRLTIERLRRPHKIRTTQTSHENHIPRRHIHLPSLLLTLHQRKPSSIHPPHRLLRLLPRLRSPLPPQYQAQQRRRRIRVRRNSILSHESQSPEGVFEFVGFDPGLEDGSVVVFGHGDAFGLEEGEELDGDLGETCFSEEEETVADETDVGGETTGVDGEFPGG